MLENNCYKYAALDSEQNFRKDINPKYKANRFKRPTDLIEQNDQIQELIDALGWTRVKIQGYEADDIIGQLSARVLKQKEWKALIIGNDKDLFQLLSDNVSMLSIKNEKTQLITPKDIYEKYLVTPQQFADYLALVGDKVDNVVGMYGCGPISAVKALQKYESVQKLIDEARKNPSTSFLKKVKKSQQDILNSYQLVKINTEEEIDYLPYGLNSLEQKDIDFNILKKIANEIESKSMLLKIDNLYRNCKPKQLF